MVGGAAVPKLEEVQDMSVEQLRATLADLIKATSDKATSDEDAGQAENIPEGASGEELEQVLKKAPEAAADAAPAQIGVRASALWGSLVGYLPGSVQSRIEGYVGEGYIGERVTGAVGTLAVVASAAKANAATAAIITRERVSDLTATTKDAVADPKVQATAAGAAGGAVTLGTGGGIAGFVGGGAVGAACGVVPAIFTFGLSIPVGAALGAGTGLAVGTTVGGTVGLVGGGATGYGAYTKREELRSGAEGAWSKALDCGGYIQAKATSTKEFVGQRAASSAHTVRSRLFATTGGTE